MAAVSKHDRHAQIIYLLRGGASHAEAGRMVGLSAAAVTYHADVHRKATGERFDARASRADARGLHPRQAECYDLLVSGLSLTEIGARLGLKRHVVTYHVRAAERTLGVERAPRPTVGRPREPVVDDLEDDAEPRRACRCGLSLPCNNCLPPLWAFTRSGEQSGGDPL